MITSLNIFTSCVPFSTISLFTASLIFFSCSLKAIEIELSEHEKKIKDAVKREIVEKGTQEVKIKVEEIIRKLLEEKVKEFHRSTNFSLDTKLAKKKEEIEKIKKERIRLEIQLKEIEDDYQRTKKKLSKKKSDLEIL